MTKRNKLLSLICLVAFAIVCACGVAFGSVSAKAEATMPTVDSAKVEAIDGVNLRTASAGAYLANASAPASGAKWIIFDWSNENLGLRAGNPANHFHMAVKNDGSFGTGAIGLYYGNYVTTAPSTKIYVSLETGETYYEREGETPVLLKTFALPELTDGQYYTVTVMFNGFEAHGTAPEGQRASYRMVDVKAYDDLGTDLGIKTQGSWVVDVPMPDVSGIVGKDFITTGASETYIANANGTKSEWIIMEWTNLAEALTGGAGAGQVYIGTSANGIHSKGDPANLWYRFNKSSGEKIKMAFNTRNGKIYFSVDGGFYSIATTIGGIAFDGTTDVYANFCIHKANTAEIAGLKIYDGEGTDLGINTSFGESLGVNPDVDAIEGTDLAIGVVQGSIANANAPAEGAKWIVFDWTNGPDGSNKINNPQNSFHMAVRNDGAFGSGAMPVMTGGAISAYDAHTRILVELATGKTYYEVNGLAPTLFKTFTMPSLGTGQYYTVTMLLNGFTKSDGTFFYMNGLKMYDDLGTDLGIKLSGNWIEHDIPTVDASGITDTTDAIFNKSCGGDGYIRMDNAVVNASGAGEGAKWIIFEWTNGASNAVGGGNGSFMGVQTDPVKIAHTKNGVSYLFTAKASIKLYVNIEDGKVYYFDGTHYRPIFKATLSALGDGQYYIVNFGPHDGVTTPVVLNDIKCYDDLGNNLGVNVGGRGAELGTEPNITTSVEGTDCTSSASNIAFNSKTATTSEWIVFEWTNGAENTNGSNHNSLYLNIVTDVSTALNANYMAAEHMGRIFGAKGKKVKLYFNTREGYLGYAIEDLTADGEIHIIATGLTTTDGTTPVYAKLDTTGNATVTGLLNGFKCYDADGNSLGFSTNMKHKVLVNFTSRSVAPRTNNVDYLLYWNINRVDDGEELHFSYSFSASLPIYIDGELTYPTNSSSAYDVGNVHCWVFNAKTLNSTYDSLDDVKPTELYFPVGYEIVSRNITYVLNNAFYVYFSGTNLQVTDTPRTEISLLTEDEASGFIYSSQKRFQGNLYAQVGGDRIDLPMYNLELKKNGTEDVLIWFEYGNNTSYVMLTELDAGYESSDDVVAQYYLLPAGSVIGNIYVTDADYIIQMNSWKFNIFRRDKVFTVTFDNLQGATAPAETTFSYATDFEVTLPSISNPEGFVFNGWKNGNDEITTITPGMFGSDVTVTANLSDGEKAVDVQTTVALGIQSDISMIFYVKVTVYDLAELSANFSFTYAEDRTLTQNNVEFVLYQAINDNVGIYSVTFDGILPQHMGDEVIFKVMEGETELGNYSASVVDYCSGFLAIEDPAELQTDATGLAYLKTLVCDLLEYGTAMQEYTAHDTANTPSALVGSYGDSAPTEFTQAEGIDDYRKTGEESTSYYWKSAALVYDYVPTLVVKFVAPESAELSVVINVAGSDDSYVETEFKNCGSAGDGLVVYELSLAFPPMMFDVVLEFAICDAEAQYGQTLEYSANAYIANVLATGSASSEEAAILKAIYNYGVSAKAYNEYELLA